MQNIEPNKREEYLANEMKFLSEIKKFILISLLKAEKSDAGIALINGLYEASQKNIKFALSTRYIEQPGTLITEVNDLNGHASILNEKIDFNLPIKERINSIQKGLEGGSILNIPVWPDNTNDFIEVVGIYFKNENLIQKGLNNVISGSFSTSKNSNTITYIPAHIEYLHEMIHVYRNSTGSNLSQTNVLTKKEKKIWKDPEEYLAIEGGEISENKFNIFFKTGTNHGHGGFSSALLLNPELYDMAKEPVTSFRNG